MSGCASSLFTPNVTTMKLAINADGSVTVSSGKDVRADNIQFADPKSGAWLSVSGYSSAANTDAITAETKREAVQVDGIIRGFQAGAAAAGTMMGGAVKGGL